MTRRSLAAACAAAIFSSLAPAVARADKQITAEIVWRYSDSSYTIDQGEKLTFKNNDSVSPGPHNVTAKAFEADGKTPKFKTESIMGDGKEVEVVGAQQLTHGDYDFYCTVHPFMTATLHVTDKGTPLPPPGSGGAGSPPPSGDQPQQPQPQEQPRDTAKPQVHASVKRMSLRTAVRRRSLTAAVRTNELATLRLAFTARLHGRTVTLART